jgi:tetratricopeptide (TPR) repeat protein
VSVDASESISVIAERLEAWARAPGEGMALVQYLSESSRLEVVERLRPLDLAELEFPSTGDVERDVRHLVDRLRSLPNRIASISGLEAAFPMGAERERAIVLLNFLRESMAFFSGRQVWWITHDGARLMRERAPDWLSWFSMRLVLPHHRPSEIRNFSDTVSLKSARLKAEDAHERLRRGKESGFPTSELWSSLAYPALAELRRAGAVAEEERVREQLMDAVYGTAQDATRSFQIEADVATLLRTGAYSAAASLARSIDFDMTGALPEREIEACSAAGLALLDAGKYAEAEPLLRRALELSQPKGTDDPATLALMNNLATLLENMGRYPEAEALYRQTLAGRERVFGVDHPETVGSMNNLAGLLTMLGRHGEAEALLSRAVASSEKLLGQPQESILLSAFNLAQLYQGLGRFSEAEQLFGVLLSAAERSLGPSHPRTLAMIHNVALLRQNQGRYAEAEAFYRRALEGEEKALGSDHPDTLATANNLAILYAEQGSRREAEALLRRALLAEERVLGARHPRTRATRESLAVLYEDQGRHSDATAVRKSIAT